MASKILSFLTIFLVIATYADASGITDPSGPDTDAITGPRDITKVLEQFTKFSTLRDLLIQTKLATEIDSRQTVTLLAVANSAISSLTKLPADVQQKVLSVHVILDYYDLDKISNLPNTTAILTTLFQSSGKATGKSGFLNATDVGDGVVKVGSAVPEAELNSEVIQLVAKQPFNLSVIEISEVIIPPGIELQGATSAPKATSPSSTSDDSDVTLSPVATPVVSSPESSESLAPAPGSEAHKASSAGRLVAGLGIGVAMVVAFFGVL